MTTTHFHYRGYDVSINAIERPADDIGPKVVVGMLIVRASDREVLFEEAPIRFMPVGVSITPQLAVEHRTDEARRRVDKVLA